jgi:hypothetical protein
MEMTAMIIQLCKETDEDVHRWVIRNMCVWLLEVVRQNGHTEQVLGEVPKFLKTKIYKLSIIWTINYFVVKYS